MEHIEKMSFVTFITHLKNKTIPNVELKQRPSIVRSVAVSTSNLDSILYSIYINRDHLNYFTIDNMIEKLINKNSVDNFYKELQNDYKNILLRELSYANEAEECIKRIDSISTDGSEFSDTTGIDNTSLFPCND